MWWATVGTAAAIIVAALWPFSLQPTDFSGICLDPCGPTPLADSVRNILLFVPLGYFLRRAGLRAGVALGAATALSCFVEVGQLWLPRTPSVADVGTNFLGAVAGVTAASGFVRPVYWTLLLVVLVSGTWGSRLAGWDPTYPIVWGREGDGSRVWRGSVTAAVWRSGSLAWMGEQLTIEQRRAMVRAVHRTQQVKLDVAINAGPSGQYGPARIVSFSPDPALRNLTLAQEGDALALRVRTPARGQNGSKPTLLLPDALKDREGKPMRVGASASRGRLRLWVEGDSLRRQVTFRQGPATSWMVIVRPATITGVWSRVLSVIFLVVLFIPAGWLSGPVGRRHVVLLAGALFTLLVLIPLALTVAPAAGGEFVAAAGGITIGVIAGRRLAHAS